MKGNDTQLTFWEHIEELRWTIFKIIGTLAAATLVGLFLSDMLLRLFLLPIEIIKERYPEFIVRQILTSPFDGVIIKMKAALLAGIIIAYLPSFYFIWLYIKPALQRNEKSVFFWAGIIGTLFFIVGVVCGYLVITPMLFALLKFGLSSAENLWSVGQFVSFVFYWLLGAGIIFELPLLMFLLTRLGVIQIAALRKIRAYFIAGTFIFAAIATPSTDPFSMLLVAIPLVVLYEISILVISMLDKKSAIPCD